MRRSFIKPAKKNPKFWEIEVTGDSYTVTEGQTDLNSQTSKDFATEDKCLKAALKAVESIREKGYKETLPEYSEWPGEKQDYAIWRNADAIEFIIRTLKENGVVNNMTAFREPEAAAALADKSMDGMAAQAAELEIYMSSDTIKIRKMAMGKDYFGINFKPGSTRFEVWYDYWAQGCSAFIFSMKDDASAKSITDYFIEHGKGKWFGAEQKEKAAEQKSQADTDKREKYLAKLKTVVNGEFKKNFSRLSIAASMAFDTNKSIYMPFKTIKEDVVSIIFDCAKSKVKQNREETLCKTYYMLYNVEKQLPLARVKQALDELVSGKEHSVGELYKDMVFEKWEQSEFMSPLSIASTENKDDIMKVMTLIAENADAYILRTRLLHKYIEVADKSGGKDSLLDETKFFALTASYPELESHLATFIGKLVEYNKEYPTVFDYPGSASDTPIPVGATAAAALAMFGGGKYDDLVASYLDTIKGLTTWYSISCSTMRNLWKEHNVTPDVPETIAVML